MTVFNVKELVLLIKNEYKISPKIQYMYTIKLNICKKRE